MAERSPLSVLAAALVAVGLIGAGWFAAQGMAKLRTADRYVTVKGSAEKDVAANLLVWPLAHSVGGNDLADVQHRLLDVAAEKVKPGGRLVYCVCSLEREEGETQVIAFLRRNPAFRTVPADPAAIGAPPEALTPEGWLRILPSQWPEHGGLDGFFAAKLERVV